MDGVVKISLFELIGSVVLGEGLTSSGAACAPSDVNWLVVGDVAVDLEGL